jgi:hypothetical protein
LTLETTNPQPFATTGSKMAYALLQAPLGKLGYCMPVVPHEWKFTFRDDTGTMHRCSYNNSRILRPAIRNKSLVLEVVSDKNFIFIVKAG